MKCRSCNTPISDDSIAVCKIGHNYFKCDYCGTLQTERLRAEACVTQNDGGAQRNDSSILAERFRRMRNAAGGIRIAMDYGCGNMEFVKYITSKGVPCFAIDTHNLMVIDHIPPACLCAVSLVEVIEHLPNPRTVISRLARLLRAGGCIYIETSTVDVIEGCGNDGYIDPSIGHITILSEKGLAAITDSTGMSLERINPTVFIMKR